MGTDQQSLTALTQELRRLHETVTTLERQVTESKRSERRLVARDAVTRELAESQSLEQAGAGILRAI